MKMQEMQEPQRRGYNEEYLESVGYPADEEKSGQSGWARPPYESQQKILPESEGKLSTTNYVLAIQSLIASSIIMGLSIALLSLTANIFGKTVGTGATDTLPNGVFGLIIASFVVSLILLLFSIAGYVFSIIQIS